MSAFLLRFSYSTASAGAGLAVTTGATLASGQQGQTYSQQLAASGGVAPYTWSLASGSLNPWGSGGAGPTPPAALVFTYTGALLGIALPNAETDSFTVQVTDSVGSTMTKVMSLTTSASSYGFNITSQFGTQIDPLDSRYWVGNNQWGGRTGYTSAYIKGYSGRCWTSYIPYAYVAGSIACYPVVCRGCYPNAGFLANGGSQASAPLVSSAIQISALTNCIVRGIVTNPIDRTKYLGWCLLDNYIVNTANPTSATVPILSVMFQVYNLDTAQYLSPMIGTLNYSAASNPTYTSSSTAGRVRLGGRMWWYHLSNETWAATPSSGYNCIRLFPSPWNDTQQFGCTHFYFDYKALLLDLVAVATTTINLPPTFTAASYVSNIACGFENNGGGPTSPSDQRYVSVNDFQTSLQSESPIIINTVPEISHNISRQLPVASLPGGDYYSVANANTADYATTQPWYASNTASSGTPNQIAIDISSVSSSLKGNLILGWSGLSSNSGYMLSTSYSLPGSYTLEGNPSGFLSGVAPTSGWTTLVTITGNTRTARTHLLGNCTSYNSLRMNVSSGAPNNSGYPSSGSNNTTALKLEVTNALQTTGLPDGHIFFGDSVTNKCLKPNDTEQGGASDYLGNIIEHYTGHIPHCECAGISGWSLAASSGSGYTPMLPYLNGTSANWITDFPGRYVHFLLGVNDNAGGTSQATYQAALTSVINIALTAGKTVIVPSIWCVPQAPTASATFSTYVTNVLATFAGNPRVMAGPDLYTMGSSFASLMTNSNDTIHPSPYGQAIYRSIYADWIARVIYLGEPASQYKFPFSVGTGLGGH